MEVAGGMREIVLDMIQAEFHDCVTNDVLKNMVTTPAIFKSVCYILLFF